MKTQNIIIIGIVIIALVSVYYSFQGGHKDGAYATKIQKQREEKDHYMRTASDSPFSDSAELFTGLHYYPVNAAYRINARLTPIEAKKAITLLTSDEKQKSYLEYAYAEFEMGGAKSKLLILEIIDRGPYRGTLFLAFADQTSAKETYGAGRYLDIKKVPGSSSVTLDFNEAYNPYCAYNDNFSCPFPPQENILNIAIEAGEKNYH